MQKQADRAAEAAEVAPGELRLLFVSGQDASTDEVAGAIRTHLPALHVAQVASLASAREALAHRAPHLVLTSHRLADGTSETLLDHLAEQGGVMPVVVLSRDASAELAVRLLKAGASDFICTGAAEGYLRHLPLALLDALRQHRQAEEGRATARQREQRTLLNTIRSTLARVSHEVNNPLAIISGNAQLLLELGRVMELDDDLVQPIRDIEEASGRIAAALHKLAGLKETIPQAYMNGQADVLDPEAL